MSTQNICSFRDNLHESLKLIFWQKVPPVENFPCMLNINSIALICFRVYSVITKDSNCEFLKIPATDYARVIEVSQNTTPVEP